MFERFGPTLLPLRLSQRVYNTNRNLDVDYSDLDVQVHIPTYNEEAYIEETLQSLVSQSPVQNDNVEIIVIDSHSTDSTREIAKQYADKVMLAPKGILTARNQGIERESPDIVLSADSADVYMPGWIDEHVKAFEDKSVVATHGTIYSKEWPFNRTQKIKHGIVGAWNLPGNNSAIRVSALENIGKFDTELNQQELIDVLLEEQIGKKIELWEQGSIEFRPYATMYKSQRRKRFSIERAETYAKEQVEGDRF